MMDKCYGYVPKLGGGGGNAQTVCGGGVLRFPENPGGRIGG